MLHLFRPLCAREPFHAYFPRVSRGFKNINYCTASASVTKQTTSNMHDSSSPPPGMVKVHFSNPFKTHRCDGPPNFTFTNKQELLDFYREMTTIRLMETAADDMYKKKLIRGFLHLYSGQEAVASGFESVLTREDHVITAYRDHAFMVTRRCGGTVKETLAELTGRITGCSKGKGGSMHMYKRESNF
jgi:pyruvate dehydrogenase E1 component alpha subunit